MLVRGRDLYLERVAQKRQEGWSEKTMSMLINRQLTACEERLSALIGKGVFALSLSDAELMEVWQHSFYYTESADKLLPKQRALCALVLLRAADEAALLSQGEESLVERLLFSQGETKLISWEEMMYAEALVKRLWCTVKISEQDDTATLLLEPPLIPILTKAMSSDHYATLRQGFFSLDATLHGLLYLTGFLYAEVPVRHFLEEVVERDDKTTRLLLTRSLCVAYDFCFDKQGKMLLLHPGLAEPERIIEGIDNMCPDDAVVTKEMILGGMNEMLPEEKSACDLMRSVLSGIMRPEYDVDDGVNDLKILVKQGAPFAALRLVMENMIATVPDSAVLDVLRRLEMEVIRWAGAPTGRLN